MNLTLEACPELTEVAISPPSPAVAELNESQNQFVAVFVTKGLGEYDPTNGRLSTHTFNLKQHRDDPANKITGNFDTIATGSDGPSDRNCFLYPQEDGSWLVYRHGQNTKEHSSWRTTANGWTYTTYNSKTPKVKPDPAAQIVNAALETDQHCHGSDGTAYAIVQRDGHQETIPIVSDEYRERLRLE
jgi:hypothetical protein